MRSWVESDGILEIVVDERNLTVTVTHDNWPVGEKYVGVSICPERKEFDEELEIQIAKGLAEAEMLMDRVTRNRLKRKDK